MNIAIILAGGSGSRVGASVPKQFINVFDKPIISYTIEAFQKEEEIDAIEIVCHKDFISYLNELVAQYGYDKVKWIVEGGDDVQHSVMNGVDYLKDKIKDEAVVLVHYVASPFVTADIIKDCIKVTEEKGNCVSATPCYLLMGNNEKGEKSTQWVNRDDFMQLNSPQYFKFGYLVDLYQRAIKVNILDKVDPHTTSLMLYMKEPIYFAKGNQTNIKITTKEDVELFKVYVFFRKNKC